MDEGIDTGIVSEEDIEEAAVDRIRDILTGSQMRYFAKQIHHTETRLCEELEAAQQDTESRLKHLETHFNRDLTALSVENQRLREHCTSTFSAVEKIQNEIRDELREGMLELERQLSSGAAKLQRRFDERLSGLLGALEDYRHNLTGTVVHEVQRLLENERFRDNLAKLMIDLVRGGNIAKVTPEERERMITKLAYLRAEQRGFGGGDPALDWREAEAEVERVLTLISEIRNAGFDTSEVMPRHQGTPIKEG